MPMASLRCGASLSVWADAARAGRRRLACRAWRADALPCRWSQLQAPLVPARRGLVTSPSCTPRERLGAASGRTGLAAANALQLRLLASGAAAANSGETAPASPAALPTSVVVPSAAALRRHLESDNHWRTTRIFGDPMTAAPPSAKHIFASCGVIESIFLVVNAGTLSPLIFEMFMPYHLKYTGLVIAWWGGTYWGLNIVQYGPLSRKAWFTARTAAGVAFMMAGVVALVIADGVGQLGPWPSYWLLIGAYGAMAAFDTALHSRQMLPPWLKKWKLGLSAVIVASLLLGVLKGTYLERNATRLVMEAAVQY